MKKIKLGHSQLEVPEIGLGCMRITSLDRAGAEHLIRTAMEQGVNFFDHADIYGGGESETLFAEAVGMNDALREQMILQTKCAIRPGVCYDFSKKYIVSSVEGSLRRLKTDYVDILLLHRPDALMEPEEVAEAFQQLADSGKVRRFGVSNHNPYQIALLNKYCGGKVEINQLQFSLAYAGIVDAGLNVNANNKAGLDRDGDVLGYCRLNDITIQAWSPFQAENGVGVFLGNPAFEELNRKIAELAEKYHVSDNAIAIAWILRHPAKIQPIVGTTNAARFVDICKASEVYLTREEWYELYLAAGRQLL